MSNVPLRSEKPILTGLIAFGVLAILVGFSNLKHAVGLSQGRDREPTPSIARTAAERDAQQRSALANIDTDGDGLTDLIELEQTRTSPFLTDSDSDGVSDFDEVQAGQDPNCPVGETCVARARPEDVVRPFVPAVSGLSSPDMQQGGIDATAPPALQLSPAELRSALTQQGFPRETLDALSDDELMTAYSQTLQSFGSTQQGSGIAVDELFKASLLGGTPDTEQLIGSLPSDPASIRKMLLDGGFDRGALGELDDEDLLELWKRAIEDFRQQARVTPQP